MFTLTELYSDLPETEFCMPGGWPCCQSLTPCPDHERRARDWYADQAYLAEEAEREAHQRAHGLGIYAPGYVPDSPPF